MKYRSRTDIVASILNTANGGANKTKIMYGAYMSFTQLKDYIQTLTASGLLEQSGMEFKTTPKGFEFLKAYESVNTLMERVESFPDSSNRAGAQPMEMPAISR